MDAFLGINVHPADLSVRNPDGSRKYVGDHAVRDAILAGERTIGSSTHIIEPVVDGGRLLMISPSVEIVLEGGWDLRNPEHLALAEARNQERLKERGDWLIFPRTIEDIARGRFAQDEQGRLHYEGKPIPRGYRLD
jgi:folate-dependent phosphoribosylglycinamide formyltransferase PurN